LIRPFVNSELLHHHVGGAHLPEVPFPSSHALVRIGVAILQSWGDLSTVAWYPYNFTTTEDGITILYSTSNDTSESDQAAAIHILCDRWVNPGVIDKVDDQTEDLLEIFMRSTYGCGYNTSLPYTCLNTTELLPSSCQTNGTVELECLEGELTLQMPTSLPVYDYSYNSDYLYIDEYYDKEDDEIPYGGSYTLSLDSLVESSSANGTYRVPDSKIVVADVDWTQKGPRTIIDDEEMCTQATTFSLASADGPRWTSFEIAHTIQMVDDVSSVHFDILLENYQWYSNQSDYLTFVFTSSADVDSGVQPHPFKSSPTRVENKNSFLEIESPVTVLRDGQSTGTANVSLTVLSNEIFVSLSQFNGSIHIKGSFGIDVPPPPSITPSSPCDDNDWYCAFDLFTLEYLPSSDNSPTWQFSLGELDQNTDSAYVVTLSSLSEILQGDDGPSQVGSSRLNFVNLDRNSSIPTVSYVPDGSAQVSYATTVNYPERWDSFLITTSASLQNKTTHFVVDIVISNYVWVSSDLLSTLQLELDIGGTGNISLGVDTLAVGPAYVQSDLYASATSSSRGLQIVPVAMSYDNSAFATITHFEGTLTVSFLVGINSTTDQPYFPPMNPVDGKATADAPAGTDRYWIWWLISVAGLLAIGIGIGSAVFLTKRYYDHKNNYSVVPDA